MQGTKFKESDSVIWSPKAYEQLMERKSKRMGKIPKVIVGMLSRGTLPAVFVQSRDSALVGNNELFEAHYAYANWHITDDGRNTVVETALEQDADYVFFMDIDMSFPKGALAMLIKHMGDIKEDAPPILGGIYCSRTDDMRWHAYDWSEEKHAWKSVRFKLNDGVKKVDAIGTGCMLIDVNVFNILEWPWFTYDYYLHPITKKRTRESEDMVFCKKCMKTGLPIYADTGVVAGHFSSMQIWPTEDGGSEVKTLQGDIF